MLIKLLEIIEGLEIIDGRLSGMTEAQLDEFARNIPEDKISCNIFGVGGYGRNEAGVMTKQFRVGLLKQMPVNFDLVAVDEAELEMSILLYRVLDALKDSYEINADNETTPTPELLKYDRTVLAVYFDVRVIANKKAYC